MRQMDFLESKTEYPKSKRTLVRSLRFTYHVLLSWKYCLHIFPTPWKGEALWWWLWLKVGWHQNWQMRELLQADHAHHTHSTRGSTISFHPWTAFHTGCWVELGGRAGRSGGDGNGDWPSLFWAPPSLFPSFHFEFYFVKNFNCYAFLFFIQTPRNSHPLFGVERGDLTKWDIEQVFGTITCLLKTPTPKPHPTTKVSFYPDTVLHQDHHLHPT